MLMLAKRVDCRQRQAVMSMCPVYRLQSFCQRPIGDVPACRVFLQEVLNDGVLLRHAEAQRNTHELSMIAIR